MKKLKKILHLLLLERGGKKSNLEDTYYFIKPTFAIKDKEGFKYTVAKVHIPWNQYKKNYEAV